MINVCNVCEKVLDNGDDVVMKVQGKYVSIPSTNSFAMSKDMKFLTGTLAHTECEEDE